MQNYSNILKNTWKKIYVVLGLVTINWTLLKFLNCVWQNSLWVEKKQKPVKMFMNHISDNGLLPIVFKSL